MKSFGLTLGILYILLAILNISFFTILMHENQVDLITRIKKYESLEIAGQMTSEIKILVQELNSNTREFPDQEIVEKRLIEKCDNTLMGSNYILFTMNGKVIHEHSPEKFPFKNEYTFKAQNAITRKEFAGKLYTSIFVNDREIHFYMPFSIGDMDMFMLLFQIDISEINKSLESLYRGILLFIIIIVIFHTLFGVLLHRLVVSPINILAQKSNEISKGNYQTRVQLKRQDEFGILTNAFNHMAHAIEEKILNLDKVNKRMKMELEMAGVVQKSIYPDLRTTTYFNIAIYHRPLITVSGDYHDFFELGNERYGCIVVDVSGHGVAAALITMLIKEKCEEIVSSYIDTKDFLKELNTFFGNLMKSYDKFFTAFYIIIDGKQQTVTYSNASHPHAYLIRENKIIKMDTKGILIGFSGELGHLFESKNMKLAPQDKIVIFTDGMYELENANRKQFGIKRLQHQLLEQSSLPCDKLSDVIISAINEFSGGVEPSDDETLMIIEMKKGGPE